MTQDEIIEMARQAGAYCQHQDFNMGRSYEFQPDQLEAFAKLVAAKEREACAMIADGAQDDITFIGNMAVTVATAIMARGQA